MPDLPSGTVTFLFTDIEGSTRLWEQQPHAMRQALARHNSLLQQVIEEHGGHVFKTIGDAFCAAFADAESAVQAALAAQYDLRQQVPQLRVRMAIHTGEAEAVSGDYFGPALNRVARLLAAGHGGQILLSRAVAERLPAMVTDGTGVRRLGEHRLRDIALRETVYQLLAPGLPADFPPLNTLDVAFRRGALRASALAAVVLSVVTGLALVAFSQARRADRQRQVAQRQRHVAEAQRRRAEAQRLEARHNLYAAQMNLARQAWEEGNLARARELLSAWRRDPAEQDLRGFEWRHLWRLCQGNQLLTLRSGLKTGAAFSPDGRLLASIGPGGKLQLWELPRPGRSARLMITLPGSGYGTIQFNCLAFSPNGRLLAVVGPDRSVCLLDLASRQVVGVLKGYQTEILSLAFSPDGRTLATTSADGRVRLWSIASRRELPPLRGDLGSSLSIAFSPDSRTLAVGGQDNRLSLWSLASRRRVADLWGHTDSINGVAFSPDGRMLASASDDTTVQLWDVAAKRRLAVLKGHQDKVRSVQFSPHGDRLATASFDGTLKLWEVASCQEQATLKGHQTGPKGAVFSPDGRLLASCAWDRTVRLWRADPAADPDALPHPAWIMSLAFSSDGRLLATGCRKTVRLWDVASRRPIARFEHNDDISRLFLPSDGQFLVTLTARFAWKTVERNPVEVRLWEISTGRLVGRLHASMHSVYAAALSRDGKLLALGTPEGKVRLWDLPFCRERPAISTGFPGPVWTLAFSPDCKQLATCSGLQGVHLWSVASRREVARLKEATTGGPLLFAPSGKWLMTGSGWELLKLWDLASGQVIGTLNGDIPPDGSGDEASVSSDSRNLAVISGNNIRLWSLPIRQEVALLRGHRGPVYGVAFSPDGNTLASASGDGTVHLWRAASFAETDGPGGALLPQTSH